jgi:hypothetical protein
VSPSERWYRRALRAYPSAFRAQYGEETIATVLEATGERVVASELAALATGGLRARLREAGGRSRGEALRGGLALAAVPIALLTLALALAGLAVVAWPPAPFHFAGLEDLGVSVLGTWWPLLALGALAALAGFAAGRRPLAVMGALAPIVPLACETWRIHPRQPPDAPVTYHLLLVNLLAPGTVPYYAAIWLLAVAVLLLAALLAPLRRRGPRTAAWIMAALGALAVGLAALFLTLRPFDALLAPLALLLLALLLAPAVAGWSDRRDLPMRSV